MGGSVGRRRVAGEAGVACGSLQPRAFAEAPPLAVPGCLGWCRSSPHPAPALVACPALPWARTCHVDLPCSFFTP